MFIASRLSAHANKLSTNCPALTQAFSIKSKTNIPKELYQNTSSSGDSATSPLVGVSCAVLAALLYLKRNEIGKVIFGKERLLPVASCLELENKSEDNPIPTTTEITKRPGTCPPSRRRKLSQELSEALKRTDHKLLVFKEKHGWFSYAIFLSSS